MFERVICFVFVSVITANAHLELEKNTIQVSTRVNAISSKCANASRMNDEQLEAAIQNKDINKITACFFKCYLSHYGLIRRESGRDIVNVPMTLVFVKIYIPEITLIDLLSVGAEAMICGNDFEKNTLSDEQPDCLKTKMLVKCLAKRKMLVNALWLAIQSWT